jgi:hypothetical protein
MEITISQTLKQIIIVFLLIILPLVTIGIGIILDILVAWFYILAITWFGMGIIYVSAIN